jgi:hypothetical protein
LRKETRWRQQRSHSIIISEVSYAWSRLRVTIEHRHGAHNASKTNAADVCQSCAIALLTDALERIRKGERVSAGVSDIKAIAWK